MALMALDHTRAFIPGFTPNPADIHTTTVPSSHHVGSRNFCARGFLLLAGAAARLQLERRRPRALAFLLVTRGALLIALELTIIGCALSPIATRFRQREKVRWCRRG
jgi:uncharacterized membrane protein